MADFRGRSVTPPVRQITAWRSGGFDEAFLLEAFEEFEDVRLDDFWGGVVLLAEGFKDGLDGGGVSEKTPDVRTGLAEAKALPGGELHEDDL